MRRLANSVPRTIGLFRTWAFEIFQDFENPLRLGRKRVKPSFMLKLVVALAAVAGSAIGGADLC